MLGLPRQNVCRSTTFRANSMLPLAILRFLCQMVAAPRSYRSYGIENGCKLDSTVLRSAGCATAKLFVNWRFSLHTSGETHSPSIHSLNKPIEGGKIIHFLRQHKKQSVSVVTRHKKCGHRVANNRGASHQRKPAKLTLPAVIHSSSRWWKAEVSISCGNIRNKVLVSCTRHKKCGHRVANNRGRSHRRKPANLHTLY